MSPELKIILHFEIREHTNALFFSESGTAFFLKKRHFYGMKYFHLLKAYQITVCRIIFNELHLKIPGTTNNA